MTQQTTTTKPRRASGSASHTANQAVSQATAIPGPRSQELQAERERYLPRGVFTYHPVYPGHPAPARASPTWTATPISTSPVASAR